MTTRTALAALVSVALGLFVPLRAESQTITVNSATLILPTASVTNFEAGLLDGPTGTTFVVTTPNNGMKWEVFIRSLSPNLGVYGKPLSELRWRRGDLGTWNAMTTTNASVATGKGGPYTNNVFYRVVLDWTRDIPGTYAATIQFTVVQL